MRKIKIIVLICINVITRLALALAIVFCFLYELVPHVANQFLEGLNISIESHILTYLSIPIGIIAIIASYLLLKVRTDFKHFKLKDYELYIKENSSEESIGEIPNKDHIFRCAERIWIQKYGEKVLDERPYLLFRDLIKDVWLVRGTPHKDENETCHIIVNGGDGKVLAVWRGVPKD